MILIPYVARIFVYPIKSLDPVEINKITVLRSGALTGDRRFAIFDQSGRFVNGKRDRRIHRIRSQFDLATNTVSLGVQGTNQTNTFDLNKDITALENWFAQYFGFPVKIKQNHETGFPDDTASPGPTIVSTATIEEVARWYEGLDVESVRRRFRSNIEIAGVPAFWEDQLFAQAEKTVNFQIGDVKFFGINPCQRCVVVTRDAQTGQAYPHFQKTFVARRQATLPQWVQKSQFNHFYRLAVNTRLPTTEVGKSISIGDRLQIN